jgi:hypothetical protein
MVYYLCTTIADSDPLGGKLMAIGNKKEATFFGSKKGIAIEK